MAATVVLAIPVSFATVVLTDLGGVVFLLSYGVPGLILAIRRPGHPIAWLLLSMAIGLALGTTRVQATLVELQTGTASPLGAFTAWANGTGWSLVFAGLIGLGLIFPSGDLPDGGWRRVAIAVIALAVPTLLLLLFGPQVNVTVAEAPFGVDVPNPYGLPIFDAADLGFPSPALWSVTFVLTVIAMLSLIARSRRATGIVSQQYRWLALALVVVAVASAVWAILVNVVQTPVAVLPSLIVLVSYPAVPIAVLVAVLRHRLYDIDRLISRTLGWAIATAVVVAVFAIGVLALQAALSGVTQRQPLAVAAATLVAFAVFQPIRGRVQSVVDRRFDRPRLELEGSLGAFGERLQHEVDLRTITRDLEQTAIQTIRPSSAALWIRPARTGARR